MLINGGFISGAASGSLGGITASHNRGGAYLRSRVVPTNPGTPLQAGVRAILGGLAAIWQNTLTSTQRAAWQTYANSLNILNPLGEPVALTGMNAYIRGNAVLLRIGLTRVDDAPVIFSLPELTTPAYTVTAPSTGSLVFDNTDSWANATGSALILFTGRPQAASINYFKGPYQLAGAVLGDTSTPPTSPASIAPAFPMTAGLRCFYRCVAVTVDGRVSQSFRSYEAAS